MKHRKLRIAWSVAWGIVAVLLVALWVRSYWWTDESTLSTARCSVLLRSADGSFIAVERKRTFISTNEYWLGYYPTTLFSSAAANATLGIGLYSTGSFSVASISYWLLTLIGVVATAAPYHSWLRLRFSLRTLLIATTLIAVVLGLIAWLATK